MWTRVQVAKELRRVGARRRLFAGLLLLAFASVLGTGTAGADNPHRIAMRLDRGDDFPYPYAMEELAGRAMDCAGFVYQPVELPDNALSRIRSIIKPQESEIDERAQVMLASESRKLDFDCIVFIRTRVHAEGVVTTFFGTFAPFAKSFAIISEPALIAAVPNVLPGLVDSLVSLAEYDGDGRWRALSNGFTDAVESLDSRLPYASWESEDLYAEGTHYGDFALLEQALEADSANEAARSLLGFRLTLGDAPAYGWGLLSRVNGAALSRYDRAVHRTRLALAPPDVADANAARDLRRSYPGRFETELLSAIPFARRGDLQSADRPIRNAIGLRPHDPLPHRILAEAGLRTGNADVAAREFAVADRLAGGDWMSITGIASTKYTQGFVRDAFEILSHPFPPRLHTWSVYYKYLLARGNLSLATGDFETAIAEFVSARDRAYRTGNRESVLDLTVRLVWANLEAGRIEAAAYEVADLRFEEDTTYFYQSNPGVVPYLEGVVAAYAGDLGEVSARRLEIETTPGAPPEYAKIIEGLYYLKSGSAWEAIPALRRALETRPHAYTRLLLGMAYFESGDASRAWTVLEENVERGESLLDSPPTLPHSFLYLAKSLEERGENYLAKIAYNELYNYRVDLRPRNEGSEKKELPGFHKNK